MYAVPAPGMDAVAPSPADLSADAAYVAAARANEEALLAGLLEAEVNLADLAAQSLLIEEAQQAAREEKKSSKRLRQRKSRKRGTGSDGSR